jgi:hypothetical protein
LKKVAAVEREIAKAGAIRQAMDRPTGGNPTSQTSPDLRMGFGPFSRHTLCEILNDEGRRE